MNEPAQAICARFGLNWEIEADRILCEAAWDAAREAAWQPIETAPRDRIIDLWIPGIGRVPDCEWGESVSDKHPANEIWYRHNCHDPERRLISADKPTHWQPITPPETKP